MFSLKKRKQPRISVVIIFYSMPDQALNTLFTLSTEYQQNIDADDYEIIVVENRSSDNIDVSKLEELEGNFRYYLRDETLPTPVNAINFGAEKARGELLCIMVDGARMVTPNLLHYTLQAQSLYHEPVVSVPGYHLGEKLQQESVLSGYDRETEKALLDSVPWREDGYRLYDISCLSGTSKSGYFLPLGESNTITVSKRVFSQLGGFDSRFTETGGGQCNLDFYKRAVELGETQLVLLIGEGSFHQFHGGVTTGSETGAKRDETMNKHFAQYRSIRGESYSPPQAEPVFLGEIHPSIVKFIHHSAQFARRIRGELAFPDTDGEM